MRNSSTPKKRWCYTLHNPTERDYEQLASIPTKYHVMGKEVGDKTGARHLQGFLVLKGGKLTPSQIRNSVPRAHWENSKGNSTQASQYCKKQGNYVENGKKPKGT